jgi:hypothetical protein
MQRRWTLRWLAAAVLLLGLVARSARPQPTAALVAVLLDSSGSVSPRELDRARRLSLEVLGSLPSGSEVAVFTFDDQSRLVLPRTTRADEVKRALDGARTGGRHTALYDALYDASRYLRDSGADRTAILLITDGRDEQSTLNVEDGLRLAEEGRIPVFAVGVGQVEERGLRRIAKLTGGQYHGAREASGAQLVAAMMAAAPAAARPAGPSSPQPGTTPGAPAPMTAGPVGRPRQPAAGGSRNLRLAGVAAAAVVLAAIGLGLARRRRGSPPPAAAAPDLSSTVVSRVGGTTEEYLEKTVVLRSKAVLAVTRGPLAGQIFDLSPVSATSLGRSKANDLVLDDVSVSSQHCRIRPEDGAFVLLDLKSTNGTFVNERRVTSHKLAEGDVIRVGEMQLQFRTDQQRS